MTFKQKCEKVAQDTGIDVTVYPHDGGYGCYQDDGVLHIEKGSWRAVFDVSERRSLSAKLQNRNTLKVMKSLRVPITKHALASEDDDICPHCGGRQ